jgi:hypothetical protein
MTRRIAEVVGALRSLSQPFIVELKEFKVRMFMSWKVGGRRKAEVTYSLESRIPCNSLWAAFTKREPEMRRLNLPLSSSLKTFSDSCRSGPGPDVGGGVGGHGSDGGGGVDGYGSDGRGGVDGHGSDGGGVDGYGSDGGGGVDGYGSDGGGGVDGYGSDGGGGVDGYGSDGRGGGWSESTVDPGLDKGRLSAGGGEPAGKG